MIAPLYSQNSREQSNGVQVQGCVELPSGPLIEYLSFCAAIAEAVCPTSARHYQDIECIVNKMVTHHVPMTPRSPNEKWPFPAELQTVLLSDDGRTLDQLLPDRPDADQTSALELPLEPGQSRQMVELSLPYDLDESDRRALQEILPSLPPLRYPISDADQAAFFDAWFSLKERPAWKPVLVTTAYIESHKVAQSAALAEHQRALQEEFERGGIEALNARHSLAAALMAGTFISRQQAIAYLELRGFSYVSVDRSEGAERGDPVAVDETERKRDSSRGAISAREKLSSVSEHVGADTSKDKKGRQGEPASSDSPAPSRISADDGKATVGKIARLPRVEELTGLKRSSIYNRMDKRSKHYDPGFPRSFSLGAEGGAVGWDEEQIKTWVAAQVAAGRG
ncbi:TPA: AlpA family phage regulatory protein [Burkholderia vietnamiensis]|uniref:AlpA family phage regulatory protein n=1 Tax=Burkholderia vietnamiensis TaxID=60552 RepID=UPI000AC0F984|nr:AlpA family phage regulatory protein [Burkholderia vietnamiensis]HDR9149366.1 AlpA family phage regulatory protein [Burkholderia vietnamiensis]